MFQRNIHSVMKCIDSMSTCSAITKTKEFSGHRPYTRDGKDNTLLLAMPLTDMFMMHAFPGSHKIAQDKFSEYDFDETKFNFIQIYCGEAVLFKSRTLFGHWEHNNKVDAAGVSKANVPFHDIICDQMTKTNGKNPYVSKDNIHSVMKFVASMSTC